MARAEQKRKGSKGLTWLQFWGEVWDYAQNRYNWTAQRLNAMGASIEKAWQDCADPMEFVDEVARGRED